MDAYQAAFDAAVLFDLSERGKVELSGPEAVIFLHNLCTNDVKNLAIGGWCEAFLTTAKAKVVAQVLVNRLQKESVLLDFVPGMSEKVMQHLDHFIISEQVELADRTNELALLRLTGPHAVAMLAQSGLAPVFQRPHDLLGLPSVDVFCAPEDKEHARQTLLNAGATSADAGIHEVLRVEAGLPEFGSDIDENRMVMEVGRVKQAISYGKGCFLGQEPIVMARDRGHVNRQLMGLRVAGTAPVEAGARVFRDQEEVGQVTSSVWSPRLQGVIALAYLKRGHQEPGLQLVVQPGERGAEATALPFTTHQG